MRGRLGVTVPYRPMLPAEATTPSLRRESFRQPGTQRLSHLRRYGCLPFAERRNLDLNFALAYLPHQVYGNLNGVELAAQHARGLRAGRGRNGTVSQRSTTMVATENWRVAQTCEQGSVPTHGLRTVCQPSLLLPA